MLSLRLQNVRSLKDTGIVSLHPLTILVGRNSSGKSSLTRFLPLLRQSVEARSSAPILWYGDFVDFGTITEVRSRFATTRCLSVTLTIDPRLLVNSQVRHRRSFIELLRAVRYTIDLEDTDEKTRISRIELGLDADSVAITLAPEGHIHELLINDIDYARLMPKDEVFVSATELVPSFIDPELARADTRHLQRRALGGYPTLEKELRRFFKERLHGNVAEDTLNRVVRSSRYLPESPFLDRLATQPWSFASWYELVKRLKHRSGKAMLERLRALYLLRELPDFLRSFGYDLNIIFRGVTYVGPARATSERYYRIRELAVDQIDPRGENLAMYLNSLSSVEQRRFSQWVQKHLGYGVVPERLSGHVSLMLSEEAAESRFNLADTGYGMSQILPVMAQVWNQLQRLRRPGVFRLTAIEQPELHLHPALQARVADAMVDAIVLSRAQTASNALILLLETHSEAIINRLGELIAAGRIGPEEVGVYLFDRREDVAYTTVRKATYDEQGVLTDWPFGFFNYEASEC